MYFKSFCQKNPLTGLIDGYYGLVESYRNMERRICHRVMLNIGFLPELKVASNAIEQQLTNKVKTCPIPGTKVLIDALGYKHIPFKPQKSVGHSPPLQKDQPAFRQKVMDNYLQLRLGGKSNFNAAKNREVL